MNKNWILGLILIVFLVFFSFGVFALEFPKAQDKYVNDFAGVLNPSQVEELRNLFFSVDQETTAEVVFVSLQSLDGDEISSFTTNLASEWEVGKADKDNGLLILYVVDIQKIWVATGYGLEGILPDSKVGRLLDENYVPLRDSGNVSEGIVEFSYALVQVILDNKEEVLSGQASPSDRGISSFEVFIFMLVLFIIIKILGLSPHHIYQLYQKYLFLCKTMHHIHNFLPFWQLIWDPWEMVAVFQDHTHHKYIPKFFQKKDLQK